MARTVSQAERIEGERQHGTAVAPVVDRYYRLQPQDLGGIYAPPRIACVRHVGVQGVERPQSILHLAGMAKPLLLDAHNVAVLTRLAASPLQRDWVGREVALAVVPEDGALALRLFAPDDPQLRVLRHKSRTAKRARHTAVLVRQVMRSALILLILVAAGGAVFYLYENWGMLVEMGRALLEGWTNPA